MTGKKNLSNGSELSQAAATAVSKLTAAKKTSPKTGTSQTKKTAETGTKTGVVRTPRRRTPVNLVPEAARLARIPVTEVSPVLADGLWPAKAVVGESFPVQATVFREGHDSFAAEVVLQNPRGKETMRSLMVDIAPGLNRYEGWVKPTATGRWSYRVETWSDPYSTWCNAASVKINAGVDVELMLEEGARLMERAAAGEAIDNPAQKPPKAAAKKALLAAAAGLRDQNHCPQNRLGAGLHSDIRQIFRDFPLRDLIGSSRSYPLQVDREKALYSSWYEIFPRSIGAWQDDSGQWHSGTLQTAKADLPRIADLGFDVVYLTPIHPIGVTHRKGKNNTLVAEPGDPGSPYGIGSAAGGHDSIHPDLGTSQDFTDFVATAKELGLEVALDVALQCSPDHPWVKEHPEWFITRSDGTIAYAENPPKKYQDIYPLSFDKDPEGIYRAIRDMLAGWVAQGVTIFRVDNPHTKPVAFWQRLFADFQKHYPEVIFLAEAFTKPAMMRTLAQVGFHQSYTYFTWRNGKEEIEEYLRELSQETAAFFRPNFWPTTHDILTQLMVEGGAAAHAYRAILAATASPSWGIYNGYELVENVQRPGAEEAIDNEKYEYKPRDYSDPAAQGMMDLLRALNRIRRQHPALQRLRNLRIHQTSSPSLLCFSKHLEAWESPTGKADTVIVVINLNPHYQESGQVYLDLTALNVGSLDPSRPCFRVRDELDGHSYEWGACNYVELNPLVRTAHIFTVEPL